MIVQKMFNIIGLFHKPSRMGTEIARLSHGWLLGMLKKFIRFIILVNLDSLGQVISSSIPHGNYFLFYCICYFFHWQLNVNCYSKQNGLI